MTLENNETFFTHIENYATKVGIHQANNGLLINLGYGYYGFGGNYIIQLDNKFLLATVDEFEREIIIHTEKDLYDVTGLLGEISNHYDSDGYGIGNEVCRNIIRPYLENVTK